MRLEGENDKHDTAGDAGCAEPVQHAAEPEEEKWPWLADYEELAERQCVSAAGTSILLRGRQV